MPTKISQLPAITTSAGSDLIPCVQGGTTYKATLTQLTTIEATARAAADTTLTTNLASEATSRANADTTLQNNINLCIVAAGTTAFTGNQAMGTYKLTGLGAGSGNGDSVRYEQVLLLAGGTMSGAIAMGSNKITGLTNGSSAQDAAAFGQIAANSWQLAGNTTGNDTSFVGTVDNHDWLFYSNNTAQGKLTKAGKWGFGQTSPAVLVHIGSGSNNAGEIVCISKAQNAATVGTVVNTTTGTSAYAGWTIVSDATSLGLYATSSTFAGGSSQGQIVSYNGSLLLTTYQSYSIIFEIDNLPVGGINTSGQLSIGGTTATEAITVTGGTTNNIKATGQIFSLQNTTTYGSTTAIDWNTGNIQYVVLTGNPTITFANPKPGATYTIMLKQDATGSRTVTWPTILWSGGSPPTLTTTASKTDVIKLVYDGANTSYYDLVISKNH